MPATLRLMLPLMIFRHMLMFTFSLSLLQLLRDDAATLLRVMAYAADTLAAATPLMRWRT